MLTKLKEDAMKALIKGLKESTVPRFAAYLNKAFEVFIKSRLV